MNQKAATTMMNQKAVTATTKEKATKTMIKRTARNAKMLEVVNLPHFPIPTTMVIQTTTTTTAHKVNQKSRKRKGIRLDQ